MNILWSADLAEAAAALARDPMIPADIRDRARHFVDLRPGQVLMAHQVGWVQLLRNRLPGIWGERPPVRAFEAAWAQAWAQAAARAA